MMISDDGLSSCPERIDTHCIESVSLLTFITAFIFLIFYHGHFFSKTLPCRRNDDDGDDDDHDDRNDWRREQLTHFLPKYSLILAKNSNKKNIFDIAMNCKYWKDLQIEKMTSNTKNWNDI